MLFKLILEEGGTLIDDLLFSRTILGNRHRIKTSEFSIDYWDEIACAL